MLKGTTIRSPRLSGSTATRDRGFDVVRLLVSWSKLEPKPGHYNHRYLREIHRAVDAAKARGIYSVIDMHQDAWGKYIASPKGVECPEELALVRSLGCEYVQGFYLGRPVPAAELMAPGPGRLAG